MENQEEFTAEVYGDEDSQGEITEEPDFSSEFEPQTETNTASESESEESSSGNRYTIYQLPCIEYLSTCTTISLPQIYNFKNLLQLRAVLLLLTKIFIFFTRICMQTQGKWTT